MNRIHTLFLPCLLGLPLAAQTPGFSLEAGAILGLDGLKKATNNASGFTLGVDYGGHVLGTDMPARVGVSYTSFPGKELNGLKTSLNLAQVHGDLVIPIKEGAFHALLGLSLNSYQMARTGTESADPMDVDHHFPFLDAKGLKLGLRAGVAFTPSTRWTWEFLFQQTELAGKDLTDPMRRQGGVNPAWLELCARYHF